MSMRANVVVVGGMVSKNINHKSTITNDCANIVRLTNVLK